MKLRFIVAVISLSLSIAKANSFVQYSFGYSQDYNTLSTQNIQRGYFNEFSYYLQFGSLTHLYLGFSYNMISSYQTESDTSSTTQSGQNALVNVRYYLFKNDIIGFTLQYSPMAKLYYANESSEVNWTGSSVVIKPGIYPQLSQSFKISLELAYYMSTYNKKEILSGTESSNSFTRTHAIPTAGIIWDF